MHACMHVKTVRGGTEAWPAPPNAAINLNNKKTDTPYLALVGEGKGVKASVTGKHQPVVEVPVAVGGNLERLPRLNRRAAKGGNEVNSKLHEHNPPIPDTHSRNLSGTRGGGGAIPPGHRRRK